MKESEKQEPVLRLCDPCDPESIVAFIEQMSGEEMTPDEIEEVRQALDVPPSYSSGEVRTLAECCIRGDREDQRTDTQKGSKRQ